jgi:hypothetical protein
MELNLQQKSMKSIVVISIFIISIILSCQQKQNNEDNTQSPPTTDEKTEQQVAPRKTFAYEKVNGKEWLAIHGSDSNHLQIALAMNRVDKVRFAKMDSVIVPVDLTGDLKLYSPFPLNVPYLKEVKKIIYFSYPTQFFATYENGVLSYTGPTNMGRKKDLTPTGLFNTNWKAEETVSTFNDEWDLRWNFNIANKAGIGWHQYSLPGYPVSHSCLRLLEADAEHLYNWADEWVLEKDIVKMKGTPVIVFGEFDFDAPKPWLQLISNPHALEISETEIQAQTSQFLDSILEEQKKRETI